MLWRVTYSSNNSGGSWWLKDKDWIVLEAAGWSVEWISENPPFIGAAEAKKTGRWLGAMAKSATLDVEADTDDGAVAVASLRWQLLIGQDPDDPGCSCCGQPHNFYADKAKLT
jgi:hypothetical protein